MATADGKKFEFLLTNPLESPDAGRETRRDSPRVAAPTGHDLSGTVQC